MDEKEVCKNCKREIPSVNYVMHLAHCLRNTEICDECGEPVLVADKEEHQRNNHQTVNCQLCGQEVVRAKLQKHMENSCSEKLVECSICELQVPSRLLNDHEIYCGSRTEMCEKCQKYVMIKDLEKHDCGPRETVKIPCEFCEEQVEINELLRHQAVCPQALDDVQILDDITPRADSHEEDIEAPDVREVSDGIDDVHISIYALPCEFCNELCPSDKLYDHQAQCEENPEKTHDNDRPQSPTEQPSPFDREDPFSILHHYPFFMGTTFDSMGSQFHANHFCDLPAPFVIINRGRR